MPSKPPHACPGCGQRTNTPRCATCQATVDKRFSSRRYAKVRAGDAIQPLAVFARDRWTCKLCSQPIDQWRQRPDPMAGTVDHILPLARGGTHTWGNVQSAHLGCNSRKGAA